MKKRISPILGWVLAGLCLIGFFLPWVRLAPESTDNNTLALANTLASGEDSMLTSYFWLRRDELKATFRNPAEGLSAYQITMLDRAQAEVDGNARAWLYLLWKGEEPGMRDKLPALLPLLALAAAAALGAGKPSPRLLLVLAAALAAAYGWLRWKLNQAYTDRLLLQVDLNLGLWISLFAAALLALLLATRALLPPKVKF
jgi:hypothetical protein